jgi:hypothetical protein
MRKIAAGHNFEAVLGSNRGSVSAQARRDADEFSDRQRQCADAFERQRADAFEVFALAVVSACSSRVAVDVLGAAYGEEGYQSQGQEDLQESLLAQAQVKDTRELAVIAAQPDPVGWPGLTAPAVVALGRYYATRINDHEDLSRQFSGVLFQFCFTGEDHDEAHYQRLQPLCQSLAEFVSQYPQIAGKTFLENMARTFRFAPVAALSGALRSWIDVFARFYDVGELDNSLWTLINAAIADREKDVEFKDAFAPLIERSRDRVSKFVVVSSDGYRLQPPTPMVSTWRRTLRRLRLRCR